MDEALKQYTAFTIGNLEWFECNCMPFWLCNAPVMFQRLMQNCLGKLNLIYCLIYLDDIIMFLQTADKHLHRLCVVLDRFHEYNLKLKPSKCSLFKEEINYLAHWVLKQGTQPSDSNLMPITECVPPWTYIEICAFLGLVGHYWWFIKGFGWIAQTLKWTPGWGGSQQKDRKGVAVRGCLGNLPGFETGLYECPHPHLCRLH